MTGKSKNGSQTDIAIWSLLGACVFFFILAWIGGSSWGIPFAIFFYLSLIPILIILFLSLRKKKIKTTSAKEPSKEYTPPTTYTPPSSSKHAESIPVPPSRYDTRQSKDIADNIPPPPKLPKDIPQPIPEKQSEPVHQANISNQEKAPPVFTQPQVIYKPPPLPSKPVLPANLINNRYEIVKKDYKTGGMAVIHLVRDYQTDSKCIMKTPRTNTDHSYSLNIEKLQIEGGFLRNSNHPNIVKYIDMFTDSNKTFHLVVDYIDGDDFLYLFDKKTAAEDRVLKWADQILDALENIHRSGVVHRDLNPGNIMLSKDDNAILIDFGTIKDSGFSSDTIFTKPGFVVPEVASRGYADEKSDIYGVGGTLFYLLTGQRPGFIGNRNILEILSGKNVSQRTSKCVAQALQYDPSFRFENAKAMRRAIMGGFDAGKL